MLVGNLFRIFIGVGIVAAIVIVVMLSRGSRRFKGSGGRGRMNSSQSGSSKSYTNSTRSNYHGSPDDLVEVPIIEVNDVKED
ncbi:MAG: hypothetical protein K6G78_01005 [bacterium]|nr:hypothetical protein [bacterium]